LSSEDKILIKTCGNLNDFLIEDSSRNSLTKTQKNIWWLSTKIAHNRFDQTPCIKRSATRPRSSRTADNIAAI